MKKVISLILIVVLAVACGISAWADDAPATLVLQTSQSQVSVGDTLTVSLSITAVKPVGKVTATVAYDASVLTFVSGSGATASGGVVNIEQLNGLDTSAYITLTFKAQTAGSSAINVTSCAVYDAFEEQYALNGTSTAVSVTEAQSSPTETETTTQTTPQTDENGVPKQGVLVDLTVNKGKLVPPFMYSIHEYTLTVPYEVDTVEIEGKTASKEDKIWYTGNESCVVGHNVRTITVTDVNGNETVYTINIIRLEEETEDSSSSGSAAINNSSADSNSNNAASTKKDKNIKDTLMPALYIILAVLVIALVIVIIWIKSKASGHKQQDKKNTKQRNRIKVSGNQNSRNTRRKK